MPLPSVICSVSVRGISYHYLDSFLLILTKSLYLGFLRFLAQYETDQQNIVKARFWQMVARFAWHAVHNIWCMPCYGPLDTNSSRRLGVSYCHKKQIHKARQLKQRFILLALLVAWSNETWTHKTLSFTRLYV